MLHRYINYDAASITCMYMSTFNTLWHQYYGLHNSLHQRDKVNTRIGSDRATHLAIE